MYSHNFITQWLLNKVVGFTPQLLDTNLWNWKVQVFPNRHQTNCCTDHHYTLTKQFHSCLKVSHPYYQAVWIRKPMREAILVLLWAMTKRTKPRHHPLESGREIRRSSLGTVSSSVRGRVWPPFTIPLLHCDSINKKAHVSECSCNISTFELKFFFLWGKPQRERELICLPMQYWTLSGQDEKWTEYQDGFVQYG